MIYKHESALHGTGPDTFRRFAGRFLRRLNTYRFYFLPALIVPLLALLTRLRDRDVQWLIATILLFMLGTNLYPYFLSHYVRGPHERVRAVERHGAAIAAQMEALDGLPRARRMLRPVSGMAFICPATSGS